MEELIIITCLIIFIIFIKLEYPKIDYKCYILTTNDDSNGRLNTFLDFHDSRIPIEVVRGDVTKTPKQADKHKYLIEPNYYKNALKLYYDNNSIRPNITYFNLGAIGCYMGHLDIYRRAFLQGVKYALVFEDNVVIKSKKFYKEVQTFIDKHGDNFELCFFHCLSRFKDTDSIVDDSEKVKWISSTKCYLIHVDNMRKYYEHFLPMDNHIDMKHEDLIAKGARVYYKDLRTCLMINRGTNSIIGHSDWYNKEFFSKQYPDATTSVLKSGY